MTGKCVEEAAESALSVFSNTVHGRWDVLIFRNLGNIGDLEQACVRVCVCVMDLDLRHGSAEKP